MKMYELTYARVVILKRQFKAKDDEDAEKKAVGMEQAGQLGLEETIDDAWAAKAYSEIDDIQDDENVWIVNRNGGE